MKKLPIYPHCFICGEKNKAGINVVFFTMEDSMQCEYIAREEHISYQGILHGGIISVLLDECMGWSIAVKAKKMFLTRELNIQYRRFIPVNTKVIVRGFCSADEVTLNKRIITAHGHIEDLIGNVYAKAEGKFVPISMITGSFMIFIFDLGRYRRRFP